MQLEHVVVSTDELTQKEQSPGPQQSPSTVTAKLPVWAFALIPAVVLLPALCLVALGALGALRKRPPDLRLAWFRYLLTLFIVSGVLSSLAAGVFLSLPRMPVVISTELPDFDQRESYPQLPFWGILDSSEAAIELKPLVVRISSIIRITGSATSGTGMGAGALLLANKDGYLFATANHTVGSTGLMPRRVMLSTSSGMRTTANVIATTSKGSIALLWVNRHSGNGTFSQPIGTVTDSETLFVVGHPEGLDYTLTTGNLTGLKGTELQMNAAGSQGNSGGPVYDVHGNLVGIMVSKEGANQNAGESDMGYATVAEVLRDKSGWNFADDGELRLQQYIQALEAR
jgi:S1-C subfamily serine protease